MHETSERIICIIQWRFFRSVKSCFNGFIGVVQFSSLWDQSHAITTNNTEILITDIGEDAPGGLPQLICNTNGACCRSFADNNGNGPLGQWTYPDGSVILNNGASGDAGQQFYVSRNSGQVIRLARRQANNPVTPIGSYCCTVPTTLGEMTLCANLGEWIVWWVKETCMHAV